LFGSWIGWGRSLSHLLCIVNTLKEKQVSGKTSSRDTSRHFDHSNAPCSRAPVGASNAFLFLACIGCGSRTAPIAFSSIQKSEYVHMQHYRVDEYMEIRIDRQAHFRLYVYLNIHNFT
jgi:hypothetical protein